ncbi:MAG: class I SAM-dependent methyltransferase [candidate division Zixibacteria bacterium]|nr:class I SAM-dependent methyltransferase [candidate division Zixibacteria bacterium]MDH3936345.1 class I SAM-dependent methyltransferase [candidate division Zixibacteria bacterium]
MPGYYDEKLSADRLRRCYDMAPPRVVQYLKAEVEHVLGSIGSQSTVLELGCGYGRVLNRLAEKATHCLGIDTSRGSLSTARELLEQQSNLQLAQMDAVDTALATASFDVVVCIQNGISAFHVDQRALMQEAVRITRPGGVALFSTYAERFWEHRLEWFEVQAKAGLLGEIDHDATGDGVIVCKDGFRATTVSPDQFRVLTSGLDAGVKLYEVDESSLFCEIRV